MKWQKKLNKSELKHIKDTTCCKTLGEVTRNIQAQHDKGILCHECRSIASKLKGVK